MDHLTTINSSKKPSPFPRAGWYTVFGSIPLGSCLPGFLLLLIHRITQLFKKPEKKIDAPLSPGIATWTNRFFYLFFTVMIVSAAFSPYPGMAFLQTAGFILLLYIFTLSSQTLGNFEDFIMEKCLPVLGISSVMACIIALIRAYFQHIDRAINLFCSFNGFGTVLIMVGGLTIGYLAWRGGKWRYLIIPYLGIIIPTLLATQSRGSWFGFAAMLTCFAALNRKLLIILLIVVILAGGIFFYSPDLAHRLLSSFSVDQNISRIFIWHSTFNMIKDHPVIGVGAGVFPLIYPKYVLPDAPEPNVSFAHNLFLQVTAEFGFIGLLFFCVILFSTIYMSFRLARTGNLIYQGIFAAIVGVLVHQQVDLPIWGFEIGGAFWMLIGLTIGLYRYKFSREEIRD